MPENKNINQDFPVEEAPSSVELLQGLENFQGIQNKVLLWIIRLLPLLALVGIFIVEYVVGGSFRDWQYISWMLVGILTLLIFQKILRKIPESLASIWNRDLIRLKPPIQSFDRDSKLSDDISAPVLLEMQYSLFIADLEKRMNSNKQWLVGIMLGSVALFLRLVVSRNAIDSYALFLGEWVFWLDVIGEFLLGFVLGVILWRLFLVGSYIWEIGKKFDLTPQPGHPDQAGGLSALGELSLLVALLFAVPGVHLGFWTVLGPRILSVYYTYGFYKEEYTVMSAVLLSAVVIFSLASFFLPLWSIHNVMLVKRNVAQRQLDLLGKSIHQLSQEMLDHADTLEPDEGEKMAKKLELMRQIYQRNQRYPVWPFNTSIQLKLIASQVLPVLGVVQTVSQLADLLPD